jgi:ethanolamine utilization protein EutQ (cupin superfamily)
MQQRATTNSRSVQKFTIDTARDWMEWAGIALADVVNEDETPDVKLGAVGFTRAPKGASSSFEFPYDEVLIVTSGICTVRTEAGSVTAKAGEVIYLPAGAQGTFIADEDTTHVYVASSPYGEVNRKAKAALLSEKAQ